jgi:hypothetical protein
MTAAREREAFGPRPYVAPAWGLIPREPLEATLLDEAFLEALRGEGAAR